MKKDIRYFLFAFLGWAFGSFLFLHCIQATEAPVIQCLPCPDSCAVKQTYPDIKPGSHP